MKRLLSPLWGLLFFLAGCTGTPKGVQPVGLFELERYLGTWYEVARLDHRFERGLIQVTAEYSLQPDGGVRIVNRGYNLEKGEWKEAVGKAYLDGPPGAGKLKVSFFGPFYGSYNIIALDRENYQWAMICGPTHKYLWILSRSPQMDRKRLLALMNKAKSLGFDTDALLFPEPSQRP